MAFIGVTFREHLMWSPRPRPFGGGYLDDRLMPQARADLARFEKEQARLSELLTVDASLSNESAYLDRIIGWTRQRIAVLEDAEEQAKQKAAAAALAADIRARHGLDPLPVELTPDEIRADLRWRELAALTPQRTKAELDAIDPMLKTKAQIKAELDARDPVLQSKLGTPIPDAIDVMAGRADRTHVPTPTPLETERPGPLSGIRRKVAG